MEAVAARVRFRPLSGGDAPVVTALSGKLGGGETVEEWERFLSRPGAIAFGADAGRALVGYAAGEVGTRFGLPGPAAWIEAFGVDLDWRAKGLGRALAVELLRRFRDAGAVRVYTLVPLHDQSLGPFFRGLGFRDEALSCLGRAP